MRQNRFTDAQIIGMIKEQEAGMPTAEVCRRHGLSPPSFYKFKAKYGGMNVSDTHRGRGDPVTNLRYEMIWFCRKLLRSFVCWLILRHGAQGEYPKAWGNCVLMVMLAEIVDAFCTENLPVENPPFGDQPDDLAARLGFLVHHLA